MTTNALNGHQVALLATHGFEESELTVPRDALIQAGATVHIISVEKGTIQGFKHLEKGQAIPVDKTLDEVKADDYDTLMLPGGLYNPDALRTNGDALAFVQAFFAAGKPVGAICHAPQILISAKLVKGRTLTGVKSIQVDLVNAGAIVEDDEVVVDHGLVTSRTPKDLPAFCKKLVEECAEGYHTGQAA